MLHAKFQDRRTSGSAEEDVQRFLPYMGVVAILRLHMKFGFDWPSGFSGEDV